MVPRRTVAELEQENLALRRAVELLHAVANLMRRSLEVDAACYAVLTGVTAGVGLGLNRAMLFELSEDGGELQGAMAVGPADRAEADRVWRSLEAEAADLSTLYQAGLKARRFGGPLDEAVRATRVPVRGDSLLARALRGSAAVQDADGDDLGGLLHPATGLAAPLRGSRGPVGVLYADNRFTGRPVDPVLAHVFALVADHAGLALDDARRFEGAARAARTDALTGLGHHGALQEALREVAASAAGFAVAMVDLDDFKQVNDTRGHPAGDALLRGLAARLEGQLAAGARLFRYGGEEFTALLPGPDAAAARAVAERLCRAVAAEPFALPGGAPQRVSCSVGVASWRPGLSAGEVLEAADRALLAAKAAGKNRVVVAEPG